MFYTFNTNGQDQFIEPHETLADAEKFAKEVADEGSDCRILKLLSVVEAVEQPYQSLEEYYGVVPGRDFPGSLSRRAI